MGAQELHCGVEQPFAPAAKAHPALAVTDVRAMAEAVERAGGRVSWDQNIPGVRRFHTLDPVGNRVEFQQTPAADGEVPGPRVVPGWGIGLGVGPWPDRVGTGSGPGRD